MIILELIGVALFSLAVWDVTLQTGDYDRKLVREYHQAQKLAQLTGEKPPTWDAFREAPIDFNVRLITAPLVAASGCDPCSDDV
ncbi:hypothetical protein [Sulfobacillus thermosulfidooxidans]|uniref:Uncharacterized protein n=2 Tax=Sulfobacillus thermosulfidooxidans TaxID=28034 RepID=A0A1W1WLQ9_SULTA|nr:hypothetical protein [Sulfobacillus thermosulfidooxidans]OLZ09482.1 hypothetical protein BFX05_10935 [Sulfobacillus thermosulfidooxidans]OLZ16212.1 hypothetical protein BFX06_04105 [Sulfobacillus thermosulfidooxidans]OLZ17940.1 hypothetical protein BFX07_06025 [Sulfobacillus thermosulfidooxidans]PSR26772.1 MAG: hypothetical protein C7B47_09975 [Sulfobacillus thermosulfidooxidans]SMC06960.1 hypothetical protein SAMN00768000_3124 [Sulfobacillus thermosulfidooxidans DSM 9293]